MQPDSDTPSPARQRGPAKQQMTGQVGWNGNAPAVQTSSRLRRCPWHADVIRLAAEPIAPYSAWRDCALIFAGSGAWSRAEATRDAGRRACTVLPPGTDPAAVQWPPVRSWVGDCGDLPTTRAVELARCLIDAGADLVQMIGENLKPSLTMRRARRVGH